ncbi:MAG: transporter permease [Clostridia bacterium]|jgi:multiple sugar transport system permease protein|nr:transporter permease [Clostridia bacterium]
MKSSRIFSKEALLAYCFVLPALLYMFVFIGYPLIYNLLLSFQEVNVMTFTKPVKEFVGFQNYIELFSKPGAIMPKIIMNTVVFTIGSIAVQFVVGFALALLFKNKFTGSSLIRGVIIIAWLIPVTVTGLLYKFIFAVNGGIINELLLAWGVIREPIQWLLEPITSMIAVITANIWIGIPFNMILILTGLTTVPETVYESASIDGANTVQKLFLITVPMIKPALMSVLTLGFIYTFKVFDLVWVMTKGGPVFATELLSTYSYRMSFDEFNFSQGAAVANILFVVLFIVGIFYTRIIQEDEVM